MMRNSKYHLLTRSVIAIALLHVMTKVSATKARQSKCNLEVLTVKSKTQKQIDFETGNGTQLFCKAGKNNYFDSAKEYVYNCRMDKCYGNMTSCEEKASKMAARCSSEFNCFFRHKSTDENNKLYLSAECFTAGYYNQKFADRTNCSDFAEDVGEDATIQTKISTCQQDLEEMKSKPYDPLTCSPGNLLKRFLGEFCCQGAEGGVCYTSDSHCIDVDRLHAFPTAPPTVQPPTTTTVAPTLPWSSSTTLAPSSAPSTSPTTSPTETLSPTLPPTETPCTGLSFKSCAQQVCDVTNEGMEWDCNGFMHREDDKLTKIPEKYSLTGCGNSAASIILSGNRISLIHENAFASAPTLVSLDLRNNLLEFIQSNAFTGLKHIQMLDISQNHIGYIAPDAFCPLLGVLNEVYQRPNPVSCDVQTDVTNTITDIDCPRCAPGYILGEYTGAKNLSMYNILPDEPFCNKALFGVVNSSNASRAISDYSNNINSESNSLWVDEEVLKTFDLNSQYDGISKEELLTGYSFKHGSVNTIRYELVWGTNLIGCTPDRPDVKSGDTGDTNWNEPIFVDTMRSWIYWYESQTTNFTIEVTEEGKFTFDSCASRYATSMAIYPWDAAFDNGFYLTRNYAPKFGQSFSIKNDAATTFDEGSCDLSASSILRDVHLKVGKYVLVIRGSKFTPASNSGQFQIKMSCQGNATANSDTDKSPAGLAITQTGEIYGAPQKAGSFEATINAVDTEFNTVEIAKWAFNVSAREQFQFAETACGYQRYPIQDALKSSRYDINVSKTVQGFDEACNFADIFTGFSTKVAYTLNAYASNEFDAQSPRYNNTVERTSIGSSTFVNGDYGKSIFVMEFEGNYTLQLRAEKSATDYLVIATWALDVRPQDTSSEANGPNGYGCGTQGVAEDPVPQDDDFTCSCTLGYSGSNCEVPPAADQTVPAIGAALGSVVIIALVVVIVLRAKLYRAKHTPANIALIQEKIMQELGFAPLSLNIGPSEFGLSFAFPGLKSDSGDTIVYMTEANKAALEHDLKATIKKLKDSWTKGLGNALENGRCKISEKDGEALLVVKKQPNFPEFVAEETVHMLSKALSKQKLMVYNNSVESVSLACPKRIPREINQKDVQRLELIGEGNFSDVTKYMVSEFYRTPYFVAAKTIKPEQTGMTREDLLKEAAMLAMFEHENVVSLVGIISVPTDMPVRMLMAYCENGTLEDYVVENKDDVTITNKLTFAAETSRGLDHISSRRIIHRDVAARNILLDSTLTCKVADLGMSTALASPDKEYVRIDSAQPIRWCAIEVLKEDKYSAQSDVWSYGICVFEIFACGVVPYNGIRQAFEVAEYIKAGNLLEKSVDCPEEVYQQLILPCLNPNPSERPDFNDLFTTAITLGGIDSSSTGRAQAQAVDIKRESKAKKRRSSVLSPQEQSRFLAPSVFHMDMPFRQGVEAALSQNGKGLIQDATVGDAVKFYAQPAGEFETCPRDGTQGCAYVDTLKNAKNVGAADALLSYTWAYKVVDVIDALMAWCEKRQREPKETYVWICSLCMNQHRIGEVVSASSLAKEFGDRVETIGRILPMLAPWDSPYYTKRAWCLFELFTAIKKGVDIDIILPPSESKKFQLTIKKNGERLGVDSAIDSVDSASATATVQADLEAIRELIKKLPGGYSSLDETVKIQLLEWFHEQGADKRSLAIGKKKTGSRSSLSFDGGYIRVSRTSSEIVETTEVNGEEESDDNEKYGFDEADTLF